MLPINLINHILQQHNPEVCHRLSAYNGMVVALCSGAWQITARIDSNGLFVPTQRTADVAFSLPTTAFSDLLHGRLPDWQTMSISGDTELAYYLLAEWSAVRYNPQNDLNRIFGETHAQRISHHIIQAAQSLNFLAQLLQFQAADAKQRHEKNQNDLAELNEALTTSRRENAALQRELNHLSRRVQYLETVAYGDRLPENHQP